jgi:adenosylcobinamide-GDP ribazoletransferase
VDDNADSAAKPAAPPPNWPGWLIATAICVRFFSRLPVRAMPGETDLHAAPDFRTVPRALPVAALVIALPAVLLLAGLGATGLDPLVIAGVAVAISVTVTGALHEDGLADTADGLFGGRTAERRLDIMKDSRIGSYGAVAIGLSLLLRASTLAAILDAAGVGAGVAALLAAACWSRLEGVLLLASEVPARKDGASAAVGQPSRQTAWIAAWLSLAILAVLAWAGSLPMAGLLLGLAFARIATLGIGRLARRLIGGQTGDIVGAAQQCAEISIYLGLAIALGPG